MRHRVLGILPKLIVSSRFYVISCAVKFFDITQQVFTYTREHRRSIRARNSPGEKICRVDYFFIRPSDDQNTAICSFWEFDNRLYTHTHTVCENSLYNDMKKVSACKCQMLRKSRAFLFETHKNVKITTYNIDSIYS